MKGLCTQNFSTERAICNMVWLCCMRQAYDRPTTRIVSCTNLQVTYVCVSQWTRHFEKSFQLQNENLKLFILCACIFQESSGQVICHKHLRSWFIDHSRLYLCSRSIILWRRLGAHRSNFLNIDCNGLWSDSTVTFSRLVMYCENFWQPNTMARHSFSICAYRCSTADSVRDAKATGCPFWRSVAPRPRSLASHWIVTSSLMS